MQFFSHLALYILCSFMGVGLYVGIVISSQSYNYAQAPERFAQQIGVLNELMQSFGQSLGVTFVVVVQTNL